MLTKKKDFVALVLWTIVSSVVLYIFSLPLAISGLFFYIVPGVYFSIRAPHLIKKTAIAATVFWILVFLSGVILLGNEAWIDNSIFSYRLFGFFDIEYFIFGFFYPYFVVIFYEYFLDNYGKKEKTEATIKRLITILTAFGAGLLVYFILFLQVPKINYSYAVIGVVFLLAPLLLMLWRYPNLLKKFAIVVLFFSFHTFLYEILALKIGFWSFPIGVDKYLSWVTFFGVSFPIEEFFFFIIIIVAAILSYYEFFDDDRK